MIIESISEINKLSNSEKLLLINELWNELASGEDSFPLSESHKNILDQRMKEHENHPDEGSSWEEVKARILKGK